MILRGCAWRSRKRIFSSSFVTARCACSRPVILPSASQAFTATSPLVSGARLRIDFGRVDIRFDARLAVVASASRAVQLRGGNPSHAAVFQPMPLPPLPSFSISGPTDVKRS